jgi:DNA-binding FrmR family transcriptional regulator
VRGYTISKDDYQKRLRRIEGQVRGLQRMIDEDAYCIDVLTQISSVTRALQGVALGLLDEHVRHCVHAAQGRDGVEEPGAMIDEAMQAVDRLLRS